MTVFFVLSSIIKIKSSNIKIYQKQGVQTSSKGQVMSFIFAISYYRMIA